ncbi:thiolase family protein, partial [Candidatus Marinimicrobia bacterium]|nr:thiolase family protein [Candidatus Neomarinimicrobiota bacterium]
LNKVRRGLKLGHDNLIDSVIHDGLWDAYNDKHMGNCAEGLATKRNYSREDQDAYAISSYKRALDAQAKRMFDSEIIPVQVKERKGKTIDISHDEEPGKVNFDKIPNLRSVFKKEGTITAANASTLNDGASVLLVMSESKAKELSLKPVARILGHVSAAHEPEWFTTAPTKAIKAVLKKVAIESSDIGLWEINEAFSVVPMAAIDDYKLDYSDVNIFGGAIALGHPIGASGARILTTLLNGMNRKNIELGVASLCIGGGEASAIVVEKI